MKLTANITLDELTKAKWPKEKGLTIIQVLNK